MKPTVDALAAQARSVGASVAVVAVRDGSETTVGTAGEGVDPTARFHVGSVGKTFLAGLVLKLVDDERLELDSPVAIYLAGPVANSAAIRLRDLLQHTSGLRDFLQDEAFLARAFSEPERPLEPAAVLELVEDDPLFEPGAGWAYASTNFLVLALVVEAVTGMALRDAVRLHLTEPLGLEHTELPPLQGPPPVEGQMAAGPPVLGGQANASLVTQAIAYGSDALVSTPSDVARFLAALLSGELLRPASAGELLRTVPADGVEFAAYGLGIGTFSSVLGLAPSPCGSAWGHLGLGAGHTTVALSRRDGSRQAVLAVDRGFLPAEDWPVLGGIAWRAFCR